MEKFPSADRSEKAPEGESGEGEEGGGPRKGEVWPRRVRFVGFHPDERGDEEWESRGFRGREGRRGNGRSRKKNQSWHGSEPESRNQDFVSGPTVSGSPIPVEGG